MLPFSSNNQIGSSVFRESDSAGYSTDRLGGSIWSSTPNATPHRQAHSVPGGEHHGTWEAYRGSGAAQIPEYQPSWSYQQQHSHLMRDTHSAWGTSEHDAWKYSRSQAPPPPSGGVWQYPGTHQDYPEWGSRAQHSAQQQGYYYVPSGHPHDQRASGDYIPYDIGSRRAYQMPPPPPGYPLPPHMQYYSPGAAPAAVPVPQLSSQVEIPPSTTSGTGTKPGGAASFLFEAAAAAASGKPSSEEKKSVDQGGASPSAGTGYTHPKDIESPSNRQSYNQADERPGKGRHGKGPGAYGKPKANAHISRVNNHQIRLHTTGNEKAPLAAPVSSGQITTLMIRNIPNRYTQSELMTELKEAGFEDKFDFFYLPMDHDTHANFGYAFINFVDEQDVAPFTKKFNGLKLNRFTSNKIIQIVPAQLQGFQANLQHYCKKAVCTDDNIDYRPLFFVDGKCLEFHRASDITEKAGADDSPRVGDGDSSRREKQYAKGFSKNNRGSSDRGTRS